MKKLSIFMAGFLVVASAASLASAVQSGEAALNNTILDNTTIERNISKLLDENISGLNVNMTNDTKPINGSDLNEPVKFFEIKSGPNSKPAIFIGNSQKGFITFEMSTPKKLAKDVSKMGYIIQGTPHGYV